MPSYVYVLMRDGKELARGQVMESSHLSLGQTISLQGEEWRITDIRESDLDQVDLEITCEPA